MADPWGSKPETLDSPADNGLAVTPNDDTDLTVTPRALYVGSGGDVVVHLRNGSGVAASVTLSNVAAGSVLAVRPTRVLATGTTASGIVALW